MYEKFKVYVCVGGHYENIYCMPMYLSIYHIRVILKLLVVPRRPISYDFLLKKVLKELGLGLETAIHIKYKMG